MVRANITGAGYGLGTWMQQRVTAIIMLVLTIVFFAFVAYLALNVNSNISSWQAAFSCSLVRAFVQIFFLSMLLHAWIGIRDLWMDYVTNNGLKLTLHVLTILWLVIGLIYSIKIIWA